MTRTWSRWLPAAVAPVVVAASVAAASHAGAAADLPDRSPEEVLAMIGEREVDAFSGSFEQTADLGLPDLPAGPAGRAADAPDAAGAADVLAALTGSHSGRVFVGGPTTARVQVMDSFAERDVVRNGDEVWVYDSRDNVATLLTLPAGHAAPDHGQGDAPTPEEVADHLVAALEPSTDLTVGEDATVAGRAAYELVMTPRTAETLVGSVAIAVDGDTGLPLAVTVRARAQQDPAFEIAYTSLDVGAPDAGLFEFVPPPGATVVEKTLQGHTDQAHTDEGRTDPGAASPAGGAEPTVVGSGWEAVLVIPAGAAHPATTGGPMLELTTGVEGGRLLSTALVNGLLADDGRVLVGSVPLERLQAAAAP